LFDGAAKGKRTPTESLPDPDDDAALEAGGGKAEI